MTLIDMLFSKLQVSKTCSDKYLKNPVLDDPSTNNMVTVAKHC